MASSSSLNEHVEDADVETRKVLLRRSKIGRRGASLWGRAGPADNSHDSEDMGTLLTTAVDRNILFGESEKVANSRRPSGDGSRQVLIVLCAFAAWSG